MVRILRQFVHDRRTLALMFVVPLFVLWLVFVIFNGNTYHPKFAAVDVSSPWTQALTHQGAVVTSYKTAADALTALKNHQVDALLQLNGRVPQVELEGSDPAQTKGTILTLQKALLSAMGTQKGLPVLQFTYLYGGANMTSFDNFGPVLIGVFAFFFVFLIAGISFLKERTSGTMERLMATPLRRWEIVLGYTAGFGLFAAIQACLIAWFSVGVLGLMMNGRLWALLLTTLLLSLTALTLGTLLSAYANTEFQMIQFIPLVIVPQVFFSGLFSMDNMAPWIRGLSKIMPLYYGADALRNVMIRGLGWRTIYPDLLLLLALSLLFMGLNVLALRKYRRI